MYIAIAEGRFGDDWLCDNVDVERAIAAWPNYQNRKLRGPRRPRAGRSESPSAIADASRGVVDGWADPEALSWAVQKLAAAAFPVSFRDEASLKAKAVLLAELCQQHPWVTPEVLRKAVYLACWQHQSEYAPPPAIFLDYCEAARVDSSVTPQQGPSGCPRRRRPPTTSAAPNKTGWRRPSCGPGCPCRRACGRRMSR